MSGYHSRRVHNNERDEYRERFPENDNRRVDHRSRHRVRPLNVGRLTDFNPRTPDLPPRLFIALNIPDHARFHLCQLLVSQIPGALAVDDALYHITLHFLGNVRLDLVRDALHQVTVSPFEISLASVGRFSHNPRAHTLWAGVTVSQPLLHLYNSIAHALRGQGLRTEVRPYHPHISIARIKEPNRECVHATDIFLEENEDFSVDPFEISEFMLVESVRKPDGRILYETRATYPLNG